MSVTCIVCGRPGKKLPGGAHKSCGGGGSSARRGPSVIVRGPTRKERVQELWDATSPANRGDIDGRPAIVVDWDWDWNLEDNDNSDGKIVGEEMLFGLSQIPTSIYPTFLRRVRKGLLPRLSPEILDGYEDDLDG